MDNEHHNSPIVLALDKNRRNLELLDQFLRKNQYEVIGLTEPEKVPEYLDTGADIKVALIDIGGFDRRIWETCELLRTHDIPFVVISPKLTELIFANSYKSGASNVLQKPLQIKQLLSLIASFVGENNG
ncbi:MAG: hypothetical protein Kow0037_04390 [Calditrichia bacterium]